jgi:putative hemolysin
MPAIKAAEVFPYGLEITSKPDLARANAAMPPLLRTYLMMGGWVSDHAVIDRAMNTLHVFTALEIGTIPEARKTRLRALV